MSAARAACILTLAAGTAAAAFAPARAPGAPAEAPVVTNTIGMMLAKIPAGEFRMGSPADEAEREPEELQHPVRITRPFYMGVHEVTQEQFQRLRPENPSFFNAARGGGPRHPVDQVMWQEAVAFCAALSKVPEEQAAGRSYRLPTEAEWEYACRAGTRTALHFGDAVSSQQANFDGRSPYGRAERGPFLGKTAPVGSYRANAFGLYDMHGNVQEWCADWYDPDYYRRSPAADPKGPPQGVLRTGFQFNSTDPGDTGFFLVVRGGSWLDEGRGCRSAYRFRYMPHTRYRLAGFRVACDVGGGS
jgi:formylglycine-generating enzyme required for sulfatase activity